LLLARCVSTYRRLGLFPQPPLPFRALTPVRIQAFSRFHCPPARLPNPPDLLSLPAALCCFKTQAADHRSRSATFPEACCSSNLLEPPPICPHSPLPSIPKTPNLEFFPQKCEPLFRMGYRNNAEDDL
jgi:hypothetical protein